MAAAPDTEEYPAMSMPKYIKMMAEDPGGAVPAFIRRCFANNPASISMAEPDFDDLTPIYSAIFAPNIAAVRVLIELATPALVVGVDVLGLYNYDNGTAMTPSELAQRVVKLDAAFRKTPAERQLGQCICDLVVDATQVCEKGWHAYNQNFACTCGSCRGDYGGWFSPRMRLQMQESSLEITERMYRDLSFFVSRRPLKPSHVANFFPLQFVPRSVARINGIFKTFYNGYRVVFAAIRDLLSHSEAIPTAANVRQEIIEQNDFMAQRDFKFFLEHNGRVEYAIACTLQYAYMKWGKTPESINCKNGGDFRTVAHMLKLPDNPEYENEAKDSQADEDDQADEDEQADEDDEEDEDDEDEDEDEDEADEDDNEEEDENEDDQT